MACSQFCTSKRFFRKGSIEESGCASSTKGNAERIAHVLRVLRETAILKNQLRLNVVYCILAFAHGSVSKWS